MVQLVVSNRMYQISTIERQTLQRTRAMILRSESSIVLPMMKIRAIGGGVWNLNG